MRTAAVAGSAGLLLAVAFCVLGMMLFPPPTATLALALYGASLVTCVSAVASLCLAYRRASAS